MAIQWSPVKDHFRIGIDLIDNGSSFTWIVYGESQAYGWSWDGTISFSGSTGGSKAVSFSSGWGQTKRVEFHRWNSPKQTYSVTVSLSVPGIPSLSNSVSRSVTVTPKPAAPSNISVARNSDSSHTVSWTRNATATSVRLERRTNDGSWQHVSSVSSNAASITDTTTKAGNKYQYRVRVANAGGTSDWSNLSNAIYTTPAAPTGVTATRVGDDIRVNATMPARSTHLDIQDDGTTVVSALAKGSLPWTHSSPDPLVTHRYRARSRIASGAEGNETLYSSWSTYSSTVQLLAPPNAPTGVRLRTSPGVSDERGFLQYQHNPVDSSEITGLRFRYRAVGDTTWEQSTNATSPSALEGDYRFTAARWESMWEATNFGEVGLEFQLSTRGAHPDWSPWSATTVMEIMTRPIVTVSSPESGMLHDARLTVEWEFFQAEDRPQSSWRARLLRGGSVIESRNGSGALSSVTFRTVLEDDATYSVEVEAATGGVWSDPDSVTVDVSFILPVPGELTGVWDERSGSMGLEVTADAWRRGVAREEGGSRVFVDF